MWMDKRQPLSLWLPFLNVLSLNDEKSDYTQLKLPKNASGLNSPFSRC